MMKKVRISPQDEKYLEMYGEDPEFSYEHNMRVIAESIEKNKKNRARKEREASEGARERSEATARYLKSLEQGKASSVESYFGKKQLAYLRGVEIVEQLKKLKGFN
jgi:hypothetical protein